MKLRTAYERQLRLDRRPVRVLPWVYEVYHAVPGGAGAPPGRAEGPADVRHTVAARWGGDGGEAAAHEGTEGFGSPE